MSVTGDVDDNNRTATTGETAIPAIGRGETEHRIRGGDASATVGHRERATGVPGPPPGDEYSEISWATMAGEAVVIKAARQPRRARLRREAEVLARLAADTPGSAITVELVEVTEGADHTELVTRRHGSVTLAEVGLLNTTERAAALISLCGAVDSLHATGWVHGALDPSHVLVATEGPTTSLPAAAGTPKAASTRHSVGTHGDPVRLCSFADARQPSGSEAATARAFDREALGTIVLEALDAPAGFGTSRERRRYDKAAHRTREKLSRTRGLLDGSGISSILLETIAKGMDTRSGARPRPDSPADGSPVDPLRVTRPLPKRSTRWRTPRVLAAALLAMLAGAFLAHTAHNARLVEAESDCTIEVGPDDHPCASAEVDQNVVTVGEAVLEMGTPGDHVIIGDWDCDGTGTAVLLEDSTGRLFHFGSWSSDSTEVTGEEIGRFQDAVGLTPVEPCAYPDVELADGSHVSPLERSGPDAPVEAGTRVDETSGGAHG